MVQPLSDAPSVSVVVPARESAATLADAVASALAQRTPGDLELVVAVGPSTDGTRELADDLAAADPRVRVVDNPGGTTPGALNAAIGATTGEVVVRVDAHAVLPDGYVETAVRALQRTGAGNVGGRQVPVGQGGVSAAVAAAMRSPLGSGGATYRSGTSAQEAETVYLGVFRRDALEEVGGYDERLLRNQDYELNHRLRAAGWTVWFDPALEVAYRPRASLPALARQYHDYGRFKRVVMASHPDSIRPRQLAPLVLVVGVLASLALGLLAWWVPVVVGGGYLALLLAGGLAADARRAPVVAAALAVMHWSWAAGFVRGVPGLRLR